MKRTLLIILALAAGAAPVAVMTHAQAQVPPRNGPYGDRDRDGIPNRYDNYDNRPESADASTNDIGYSLSLGWTF